MASHPGPHEHDSAISIVTLVLLVASVLAVCTRVGMKLVITHRIETDDIILLFALLFSAGQSVSVLIQSLNGLGRQMSSLTASQLIVFQKTGYAAKLLFVVALGLSKCSVVFLLRQINPDDNQRLFLLLTAISISVWSVATFFAAAFQCTPPRTWEILGDHCFNRVAFWRYYGVTNIITEAVLIVVPIYIFWHSQIAPKQKIVLFCCFGARIAVVATVIPQVILYGDSATSADFTLHTWLAVIFTQLVQNLSIITACIPYIKNFYLNIESGMIRTDDLRRRQQSTSTFGNYNGKHPSSGSSRSWRSAIPRLVRQVQAPTYAPHTTEPESYDMNQLLPRQPEMPGKRREEGVGVALPPPVARGGGGGMLGDRGDAEGGPADLRNGIRQTTTWAVERQPAVPLGRSGNIDGI